jgi:hypothetical protein
MTPARASALTLTLLAAAAIAACSGSSSPDAHAPAPAPAPGPGSGGAPASIGPPDTSTAPTVATGRTAVPAPIEATEIVVRESQPPQYAVKVTSGLPSGCAKFERIDAVRDGYVVNVSVWNTLPSDQYVACTMIYGITEHTAELGSDFTRGEAYAVHVNGEPRASFTPQ